VALTTWLIDTSAFHKLTQSPDLEVWLNRIDRGLVFVSPLTLLEVGYSLKSAQDHSVVFGSGIMRNLMKTELSSDAATKALDIQHSLLLRGQHRGPSVPDLLTAALGLLGGHTLVHDDSDFVTIAAVTGQSVEKLRTTW
jgi:predicted nucleic acid-binding protein